MATHPVYEDSYLSRWLRVREYAVPPVMIEQSTARRAVGDWAGACAAAHLDVDLDLRTVNRAFGREFTGRLRSDLRHLAPDLLRWHLPRTAPDGLLRAGLTLSLARYRLPGRSAPVHLVARTPPAWADGGQRFSLALWGADDTDPGVPHPHLRPDPRFRFDLHRHLWDVRRTAELPTRVGADRQPPDEQPELAALRQPDLVAMRQPELATARWAAEAALLRAADGCPEHPVVVRLGIRHRRLLLPDGRLVDGEPPAALRRFGSGGWAALPVLPDASTWTLPDLLLLRSGVIDPGRLHPLVASALAPGYPASPLPPSATVAGPQLVDCQGARHRIGLVEGVLSALDHDPAEIAREQLIGALGGRQLPCLETIERAHRHPEELTGVRERLVHGDTSGALAVIEALLGPAALLPPGRLREELEAAAERRVVHGLHRADLLSRHRPTPRTGRRIDGRVRVRGDLRDRLRNRPRLAALPR
ncbi:hypothetical protein ACIRBX_03015 [Kitasatospora sp. NPDC096147]|uniref:hypothetical protein n=1 Tax=Kitasatospora sp. NPDC096147 TaxID=3364093 RepID=UPI003805A59E